MTMLPEAFELFSAQLDGLSQLSMASVNNPSVLEARRLAIRRSLDHPAQKIQGAFRSCLSHLRKARLFVEQARLCAAAVVSQKPGHHLVNVLFDHEDVMLFVEPTVGPDSYLLDESLSETESTSVTNLANTWGVARFLRKYPSCEVTLRTVCVAIENQTHFVDEDTPDVGIALVSAE